MGRTDEEGQAAVASEARPLESGATLSAGSTTPTQNTIAKKSRTFLDLGPLTGFLRSRYPSTTRSTNSTEAEVGDHTDASVASSQQASLGVSGDLDDEDDRRTIRDSHGERGAAEGKTEAPLREAEASDTASIQVTVAASDTLEKLKSDTVAFVRGQVSC